MTQPEALRLADDLIYVSKYSDSEHWNTLAETAAELRRLHAQRLPLTEEEIHDCFQQRHKDKATERRMITRAIERAHGIT